MLEGLGGGPPLLKRVQHYLMYICVYIYMTEYMLVRYWHKLSGTKPEGSQCPIR